MRDARKKTRFKRILSAKTPLLAHKITEEKNIHSPDLEVLDVACDTLGQVLREQVLDVGRLGDGLAAAGEELRGALDQLGYQSKTHTEKINH